MGGVRSWSRWADEVPVALFRFSLSGRLVAANTSGEALVGPVRADALSGALEEQHRLVLDGWLQSLAGLDDGTTRRLHLTAADGRVLDLHGLRGSNHITLSVHDVTDYVREHKRLARDLRVDTLTGLANRQAVVEEARRWQIGSRSLGPSTILLLDIDGFKEVNDRFGHQAGDLVLTAVATSLSAVLVGALVGRVGGDQFVAVVPGTIVAAERLAERTLEGIAALTVDTGRSALVRVSASAGVAAIASTTDVETTLQQADAAMHQAKASGRGRYRVFTPSLAAEAGEWQLAYRAASHLAGQLAHEARFDARTRLLRDTVFGEDHLAALDRARFAGVGYGLVLVDIDRFHAFNERYLYEAGNDVLAAVARTVLSCTRAGDHVYRYGGEELVVLVEGDEGVDVRGMAERIRASVERLGIPHDGNPPAGVVTVTVGAIVVPGLVEASAREVIDLVSGALMQGKAEGRNRVAIADAASLRPTSAA